MCKAHIRAFQPECPGDSKGGGYSKLFSARKATELVSCSRGDEKRNGKGLNRFRDLRRTLVLVAEAASSTQLASAASCPEAPSKVASRGMYCIITYLHT